MPLPNFKGATDLSAAHPALIRKGAGPAKENIYSDDKPEAHWGDRAGESERETEKMREGREKKRSLGVRILNNKSILKKEVADPTT